MNFPSKIAAGDQVNWSMPAQFVGGTEYRSDTHTLRVHFRGPVQAAQITVVGVADGTGWELAVTSAQSAAFNPTAAPVVWHWQAVAELIADAAIKRAIGHGQTLVGPNFAALGGEAFDGRSLAEKNLDAVNAEIESRICGKLTVEYTIAGRSLKKEPMSALLALRTQLRIDVHREKAAQAMRNGLGNPGKTLVRFGGP